MPAQTFNRDNPPAIGVELRGGALAFDGRAVFKDLDLDIPAGQTTCLLGASGVGKSSLLRLIAGISPEATARHLGASDGGPIAGRIAYMDQRDLLLPWLNVLANVTLGARLRGEAPDYHRAGDLLARVGLADEANALPSALSGGMRQRVGLARALSVDADVLLMDEPFSAVDEQTRRKFQEDLLNLVQNENKTFIFVTHSIEEAVYVSDQIAILLPRPSRVSEIIRPSSFRNKGVDNIRRDPEYLDIVDDIWSSLRTYVE